MAQRVEESGQRQKDLIPLRDGCLLPAYTITGFDASAHAAEETINAAESVPRGIIRSVLVSGVAGWILLCVVILAAPSLPTAAAHGEGAFLSIMNGVLPRSLVVALVIAIVLAQYLCGLATVTSASRMAFAFAATAVFPSHMRYAGSARRGVHQQSRSGWSQLRLCFSRFIRRFTRP